MLFDPTLGNTITHGTAHSAWRQAKVIYDILLQNQLRLRDTAQDQHYVVVRIFKLTSRRLQWQTHAKRVVALFLVIKTIGLGEKRYRRVASRHTPQHSVNTGFISFLGRVIRRYRMLGWHLNSREVRREVSTLITLFNESR